MSAQISGVAKPSLLTLIVLLWVFLILQSIPINQNQFKSEHEERGTVLAAATVDLQVQGDDDDAYESDTGSSFNRTTSYVRMYSNTSNSSRYNGGHRFTGVDVPQGAIINSATLEFYRYSSSYNDPNVDIFAEDVDNSVDFFANADVTSRVRTTASVPWVETSVGSGWNLVPTNISPVVQEIVDRSGWTSGNALTVLVDGRSDINRTYRSRSRDYSSGTNYGAKLHITYTESFPDPPAVVGSTPDGAYVNSVSDPLVPLRIRDNGPAGTYPNTYHWNQFQVYRDNGDGTFNSATDALVQENSESQLPMVEANYPPGGEVGATYWIGGETSGQIFFWRARLNNDGSDFSTVPPESLSSWSSAWSFTVDNDAPTSTINQPPCDVASGPASLAGTASDALSGVDRTAVAIQRQSDGFYWDWGTIAWISSGSPLWSYAVGTTSWSIDTSSVTWTAGQDYTVFSSAEDKVVGNFNVETSATSLGFTVGTCDLQITDTTYVPVSDAANPTESGVTISANVSVKNFGVVDISASFDVSFCWDNSSSSNCTATTLSPEPITNELLADETQIVMFSFTAPTVAGLTDFTGKAVADSGNVVLESDETNNEALAPFSIIPKQPEVCLKTTGGDVGAKGRIESCDQGEGEVTSGGGDSSEILATGKEHSCVVLDDGKAMCWGKNVARALGHNNSEQESDTPVFVVVGEQDTTPGNENNPLENVKGISAGKDHTCALLTTGEIMCWGGGSQGELGNNDASQQDTPAYVHAGEQDPGNPIPLVDVKSIEVGEKWTCAVMNDGRAMCWGNGDQGQLGNGKDSDKKEPVYVHAGEQDLANPNNDLINVQSISAGDVGHTCAVLTTGEAMCWGLGNDGRLGNPSAGSTNRPVYVRNSTDTANLPDVKSISAGQVHTCAVLNDENALCWGGGQFGKLGLGNTTTYDTPQNVMGGVDSILASYHHTCAVMTSGEAMCWGRNQDNNGNDIGYLGDGTLLASNIPVSVLNNAGISNLTGVTGINLGYFHSCAIVDGGVKCWGRNIDGQLGTGVTDSNPDPHPLPEDVIGLGVLPLPVGGGAPQFRYAYVTSQTGDTLTVVDVIDPDNPVIAGSVDDSVNDRLRSAYDVSVSGNYAYVINKSGGELTVVDISDPANPFIPGPNPDSGTVDDPSLGGAHGVAVSGDYVYVAARTGSSFFAGGALTVVDVSDPENPVIAGSVEDPVLDRLKNPWTVFVFGDYAYLADGGGNALTVVDVSDPANPVITGSVSHDSDLGQARSVFVSGKYAYVAARSGDALTVVDVSDPANPVITGSVTDPLLDEAYEVAVSGNYAYVVSRSADRLTVIDISDPTNPVIAGPGPGSISDSLLLNAAHGIAVSGDYAYVAARDRDALTVVDVSDPANPVISGPGPGSISDSSVLKGARNVALAFGTLPPPPFVPGMYNADWFVIADESITNFYSAVDWLVEGYNGGINTGFTSGNEFEELWDQFGTGATSAANGVIPDTRGVYAYPSAAAINSGSTGPLEVVDFTWDGTEASGNIDPVVLFINGDLNINDNLDLASKKVVFIVKGDINVRGSGGAGPQPLFAYMASQGADSLTVVDISDPANPFVAGTVIDPKLDGSYDVVVSGNYAYVASRREDTLTIVDISDPANPFIAGTDDGSGPGSVNLLSNARSVAISGSYAYVASDTADALTVVDISDPANPFVAGTVIDPKLNSVRGVTVSGSYAYVASRSGDALTVVDISDPANPFIAGTDDGSGPGSVSDPILLSQARNVSVSGGYAYVTAHGTSALTIVDISDPANPFIAGSVVNSTLLARVHSVVVSGNYAYLAARDADALTIVDISDPANPFIAGTVIDPKLDGVRGVALQDSSPSVARIDGFFIPGGAFNSGVAEALIAGDCPECQLVVNGGVIAFGGVNLDRNLGTSSSTAPAVIFNYKPEYIYIFATIPSPGASSLLGDDGGSFEEVSP